MALVVAAGGCCSTFADLDAGLLPTVTALVGVGVGIGNGGGVGALLLGSRRRLALCHDRYSTSIILCGFAWSIKITTMLNKNIAHCS